MKHIHPRRDGQIIIVVGEATRYAYHIYTLTTYVNQNEDSDFLRDSLIALYQLDTSSCVISIEVGPTRELFSFNLGDSQQGVHSSHVCHDLNTRLTSSRIILDTKFFHRNLMTVCIKIPLFSFLSVWLISCYARSLRDMAADVLVSDVPIRHEHQRFRSISSVFYNCAFTLLLCLSYSIRPNLPSANASQLQVLLRKLNIVFWMILFPEWIVGLAMKQWYHAFQIAKCYRGVSNTSL